MSKLLACWGWVYEVWILLWSGLEKERVFNGVEQTDILSDLNFFFVFFFLEIEFIEIGMLF